MLISFKCMFCRPDMNTTIAQKSDFEDVVDRLQKIYKKKREIEFMENVIVERQVRIIRELLMSDQLF